jgi:hypothetical protein
MAALEWEERAQHQVHWRLVTLYNIVSQTARWILEELIPIRSYSSSTRMMLTQLHALHALLRGA